MRASVCACACMCANVLSSSTRGCSARIFPVNAYALPSAAEGTQRPGQSHLQCQTEEKAGCWQCACGCGEMVYGSVICVRVCVCGGRRSLPRHHRTMSLRAARRSSPVRTGTASAMSSALGLGSVSSSIAFHCTDSCCSPSSDDLDDATEVVKRTHTHARTHAKVRERESVCVCDEVVQQAPVKQLTRKHFE